MNEKKKLLLLVVLCLIARGALRALGGALINPQLSRVYPKKRTYIFDFISRQENNMRRSLFILVAVLAIAGLALPQGEAQASDDWSWDTGFGFGWRPSGTYTIGQTSVPDRFVGSECRVSVDVHNNESIWYGNRIEVVSQTIATWNDVENGGNLDSKSIILDSDIEVKFYVRNGSSLEATVRVDDCEEPEMPEEPETVVPEEPSEPRYMQMTFECPSPDGAEGVYGAQWVSRDNLVQGETYYFIGKGLTLSYTEALNPGDRFAFYWFSGQSLDEARQLGLEEATYMGTMVLEEFMGLDLSNNRDLQFRCVPEEVQGQGGGSSDGCPECGERPHMDEVLVEYERRNGAVGEGMTGWVCDFRCDENMLIVLTENYKVHHGYRANEYVEPRVFSNAWGTYYVYFGPWLYESYYLVMEDGSIENMITLHQAGVADYGPCSLTPDNNNPWQWDGSEFVLFPGQSPDEVSAHMTALEVTPSETVVELFSDYQEGQGLKNLFTLPVPLVVQS